MTAQTMIAKLREHTKAKGNNDLAEAIGWDKGNLSKLINGNGKDNMSLLTIKKISINTKIPVGQLAEWWCSEF